MSGTKVGAAFLAAGLGLAVCSLGQAATLTYEFSSEVTGADEPTAGGGAPPWLTATFDDGGSAGSVNLALEGDLQSGSEFFSTILFNMIPDSAVPSLSISHQSGTAPVTANVGLDSYSGGGGTSFDIELAYPTSGSPGTDRFDNGELSSYLLTGNGITATSFDAPSDHNNPNKDRFRGLAHVQGIPVAGSGDGGSGWIAPNGSVDVPTPGTLALLAGGLLGAGWRVRRR